MVNLEHKLTVDDLIVEYMIYKTQNGYESSFTTSEFITFLYYFTSKMEVKDVLFENVKLFQRFFERKNKEDWSTITSYITMNKEIEPHMTMSYSEEIDDYIIAANYKLSAFDQSIINTYFMDKIKVIEIRNIIGKWLEDYSKRKIDKLTKVEHEELLIGKYISVEIISSIWNSHINELIKNQKWPIQCRDINKYLLEIDLAKVINIKSIKKDLIELYNELSERIAILYHYDKKLKISNRSNSYLAKSNYDLIIQDYEKLINSTFGDNKITFDVDLSSLEFKESYIIDRFTLYDEDEETKTTSIKIGNKESKKLVKILNNNK